MKVLVLNCGGSSVKYQIFDMADQKVIAKGMAEKVGVKGSLLTHSVAGSEKVEIRKDLPDHEAALSLILETISGLGRVDAVGHRVVHAGEKFNGSVIINDAVIEAIEECADLAPLHNPPNLLGIRACMDLMPGTPQVASFDNAYHKDLPDYVRPYAIPHEYFEKYGVRRYGFHGIAFTSMSEQASQLLGRPLESLRLVNLMLGSGTTANALKYGKSYEVSTGFTPCEGLIQSTRVGDIDPAVITWLMKKEGLSPEDMDAILYKKGGWLGISGVSSDLRDVTAAAKEGNEKAQRAIDAFCHRCRKYVGGYAAAMGGIDALVFSGGIGEKAADIRASICSELEFMGIELDPDRNGKCVGHAGVISSDRSKAKIIVVMVDEEIVIARETFRLTKAAV